MTLGLRGIGAGHVASGDPSARGTVHAMANKRSDRPRRALDRSTIARTAVEIADREDLAALTIRRLAQELDVPAMTLYGYVANKDEILDAMADSIMGSYALPPLTPDTTAHDAFVAVTARLAELFRRHPSVARILTMRVTNSPDALDGAMEQILDRFLVVGMPPELAVQAYGAMMHYALGSVLYQLPRPWGDGTTQDRPDRAARVEFYRSLDAERFPRLRALSDVLPTLPSKRQFECGLDALATGLALDRVGAEPVMS